MQQYAGAEGGGSFKIHYNQPMHQGTGIGITSLQLVPGGHGGGYIHIHMYICSVLFVSLSEPHLAPPTKAGRRPADDFSD